MSELRHGLPDLAGPDRAALLALARATIENELEVPSAAGPEHRAAFDRPGGAFVTVHVDGHLRGCVGLPECEQPLGDVIRYCARAAAFGDPRFPPLTRADVAGLSLEISILTSLEQVTDLDSVYVGRDGLVVEQGMARGLLLPQVAVERGWTREQFLDHACLKAGLPPHTWRQGARVFRFEAIVFSEGGDQQG